ncbi:MAG: type II secretion system F family protein [Dehalococcoidia bacterium]|nr:type II secretion system F family protein [Dehalococcoidia bacterium]
MELMIAFGTFLAVTLMAYGLLYRQAGDDPMGTRLGGLRYSRPGRDALPDPDAAFTVRVIRPIVRNVTARLNAVLPSTMSERMEKAITQAGLRLKPGHFLLIVGFSAGILPIAVTALMASSGQPPKTLFIAYGVTFAMGIYGPRIWLLGKIKRRQKEVWKSLPDAFDLITASVEAGLGIDASFNRVIEKVKGPFADELTRTMREISMGRSRRESLVDMSERIGVDELRQLVNAIVQAEAMGISIGSVIRVQTGVIRTKRRQRAEEAAMKAPIKMVFPLVFFIFPTIMVVIGGPAIIQMRDAF